MKDLFVLVADEDARQFLSAVLSKSEALGIRPITFDIERHPYRDRGVVNTGPELTRSKKSLYQKCILLWDHEGSGKEGFPPDRIQGELVEKLEAITWSGCCAAVAIVPELEAWLWATEAALSQYYLLDQERFLQLQLPANARLRMLPERAKLERPKELFELVVVDGVRKSISPRDFLELGTRASVPRLETNQAFGVLLSSLRRWFPPVAAVK